MVNFYLAISSSFDFPQFVFFFLIQCQPSFNFSTTRYIRWRLLFVSYFTTHVQFFQALSFLFSLFVCPSITGLFLSFFISLFMSHSWVLYVMQNARFFYQWHLYLINLTFKKRIILFSKTFDGMIDKWWWWIVKT